MQRKGQAAMEFLMTYGWAILVVLVAIGALAYFGILSPSKFLPSSCMLSGGFSCTQYKVTASSVTIGVQNNLGVDADQVNVTLDCASGTVLTYNNVVNGNALSPIPVFNCTNTGTKFKGNFNVTFIRSGDSLAHTTSGSYRVHDRVIVRKNNFFFNTFFHSFFWILFFFARSLSSVASMGTAAPPWLVGHERQPFQRRETFINPRCERREYSFLRYCTGTAEV